MAPTRRAVLGATAAAAASLAGCTGGQGTSTGTGSPGDGAGGSAGSATVQVRSHGQLGDVLVGPDGRTLYMFEQDTEGQGSSSCSGSCADTWPPLTVDGEPTAGDGVTAQLTTFERQDGSTQVAAAGWPLYSFASDERPGDAKGQGVDGAWWVLRPDGTPVKSTGGGATSTPTPTPTSDDGGGGGGDGGGGGGGYY